MIDAETFEVVPIRIGSYWSQTFQFDSGVFDVSRTYETDVAEYTGATALLTGVVVTATSSDTIEVTLSESNTTSLSTIQFENIGGVYTGYVFIDVIRTDSTPDEPMNILIRLPVIKGV